MPRTDIVEDPDVFTSTRAVPKTKDIRTVVGALLQPKGISYRLVLASNPVLGEQTV